MLTNEQLQALDFIGNTTLDIGDIEPEALEIIDALAMLGYCRFVGTDNFNGHYRLTDVGLAVLAETKPVYPTAAGRAALEAAPEPAEEQGMSDNEQDRSVWPEELGYHDDAGSDGPAYDVPDNTIQGRWRMAQMHPVTVRPGCPFEVGQRVRWTHPMGRDIEDGVVVSIHEATRSMTVRPDGWDDIGMGHSRPWDECAAIEASAPDDAPRDHSMDCYRERLTAQYAEHAQPAVDRADPAESNLAAYAEMMQGHAQESEARALAAEERADAAEWAVGELRAALEGLLEEPEIERRYCPRCGKSLDQHPVRHAAGCPVGRAEDALRDTADQSQPRKVARYEALVQAAEDRNTALEVALRSLIYGANWLYGDAERATRALEGSTNELAHVRGELIVALSDLKGRIVFAQQTLHSGEDALKNAASGDKLAAEREAQAAEGRNAEFERRLSLAESKIGALLEAAWVIVDPSGNAPDAKTALRAALAALEGESHD